jgi:hypothetical protein
VFAVPIGRYSNCNCTVACPLDLLTSLDFSVQFPSLAAWLAPQAWKLAEEEPEEAMVLEAAEAVAWEPMAASEPQAPATKPA